MLTTRVLSDRPLHVEATLNYLLKTAERPGLCTYDFQPAVPGRQWQYDKRAMRIHDARPINEELSLDVQGFIVRRYNTVVDGSKAPWFEVTDRLSQFDAFPPATVAREDGPLPES